jgi:hypothetical protein
MAVRTPLYYVGGNLRQMSSVMLNSIGALAIYRYSLNPSVILTVVGSGGNLTAITDTRKTAGASITRVDRFATEAETAEPGTVTVSYQRVTKTNAEVIVTADTGKTFPIYYNAGGNIQAMTATDFRDTFISPSIDKLILSTTTTDQAGTYFISTATSVTGSTRVSATPIFIDTRANTALYTAAGIPETLDQPTTINSYYLYRVNGSPVVLTELPLFIDVNNNLKEYSQAEFETLLGEYIRNEAASSSSGYQITYTIGSSGTGNIRGTGMANTILNGAGNYQTRFVNTNDYRAQEFPNGTAVTANTYYLRINKT